MSLSENRKALMEILNNKVRNGEMLHIEDVFRLIKEQDREAVKELKKKAKHGWEGYKGLVHIEDIDEIFGKELT